MAAGTRDSAAFCLWRPDLLILRRARDVVRLRQGFETAMRAFPIRPTARSVALASVVAGCAALGAAPALAQSAECQKGGAMLNSRQALVAKLSALGSKNKKQVDPRAACTIFGQLVSNGNTVIKWLDANKDWCSIPDGFVENLKGDHAKAADLRNKACAAASQMAAMEKKALEAQRQQQAEGGGPVRNAGPLGGPGLTGSYKLPQGAL
jgi:hypothetical protein